MFSLYSESLSLLLLIGATTEGLTEDICEHEFEEEIKASISFDILPSRYFILAFLEFVFIAFLLDGFTSSSPLITLSVPGSLLLLLLFKIKRLDDCFLRGFIIGTSTLLVCNFFLPLSLY